MNAKKLLQKYAAGQRDFQGEKLQGQSFRDKNLSGADFSNANIRGTDFTDAILKGVIFDRVDAGLQRRWLTVKLVPIFFVAALAGILQGYFGWWIARYVNSEVIQNSSFLAIIVIFTYTTLVIAIGSQGLDLKALVKIAVVDIIIVAIIVGIILPFNTDFAFNLAGAVAVGGAGAFAVSFADAVTISFTLATSSNIIFIW
jgi:Pentapeptide repeats (8 copies)